MQSQGVCVSPADAIKSGLHTEILGAVLTLLILQSSSSEHPLGNSVMETIDPVAIDPDIVIKFSVLR